MVDAVELIGYVASALVVLSLTMASLLRLRIVSLVGSLVFATYGLLIGSPPVLVTNAAIAVINVVHLRRLWRERADQGGFEIVPADPGSPLLRRFLDVHAEDVARFQPRFSGVRFDHEAWWVVRDGVPAGAVLARRGPDGGAHVDVDFVTPAHRDLRPGRAVYGAAGPFSDLRQVTTDPPAPPHERYLRQMGFRPAGEVWARERVRPGR